MVDWRRGVQGPQRRRPPSRRAAASRIQRVQRGRRGGLVKAIKSISLSQCETKQSSQYTAAAQQLYHNLAYYAGELLATTQGVQDPDGADTATRNRIGDQVIGRALSIKLFMSNTHDRPNVMYRLTVFKYNTLAIVPLGLTDAYFWSGLDGFGSNMNRMLDSPNRQHITVVKSVWISPSKESSFTTAISAGTFSGHEKSHMIHVSIPLKNKKITYNSEGGSNTKFTDYGFSLCAYDTFSTLQTDIVGSFQWVSKFTFKDP